jgi:alginate O-acetyltransferase complex protein AlgJ
MRDSADPLALPAVPDPASALHPLRDCIVAIAFVVALAAVGVSAFRTPAKPTLLFENRAMAPWPAFTWSSAFPAAFERAFGDRFGARDTMLRLHHLALVYIFNVSPAPNVLLGRDGWLYFLGEDGHSIDRHYRSVLPISDSDLRSIVAELKRREQFLSSLGIPFVVTIVPDKSTIYPEHLPRWIAKTSGTTALDRLIRMIEADGSVRFVDLRAPLARAKLHERVYYMTDSHWNMLGAAVGYEAIMREVQSALPSGRLTSIAPPKLPPYVPGIDVYSGDLAINIGLPPRYREPDLAPIVKIFVGPWPTCAKRLDNGADEGFEYYACDRPNLPRAVMYRDSMAIPLMPLLSENFSRIVYVSSPRLDSALILRENPDVVIEEMVERGMFGPAALPMPDPPVR